MPSKLKQTRLERGYSVEAVSDKLNIRRQYLIDLEEGNFDALPGRIYVDGYIKIYSKFLGIDADGISDSEPEYIYENDAKESGDDLENLKQDVKYQKYFIIASIISLIIIFLSYNIIKVSNNSGLNMFKEVIVQKFRGNKSLGIKEEEKMDYALGDLLSEEGIYIDQNLAEEDDMLIDNTVK